MTKRYALLTNKVKRVAVDLDNKKLSGFKVKPRNKVSYDGVKVTRATIINPAFIEVILKRKNDNTFKKYLQYVIELVEDDDSDDAAVYIAMDELSRFRSIILNRYKKFLKDKDVALMLEKIKLLESELARKNLIKKEPEEKSKKSR